MTQIVLDVEEELLSSASVYAQQHQTSIDALLTDYLRELDVRQQQASAVEAFLSLAEKSIVSSGGVKIRREELYER